MPTPLAASPPTFGTNMVMGLLLPPESDAAVSLKNGAGLGVELANQAWGVNARLVIRGRTGQWGADGMEAARMILDDGAQGLIAPPDGAACHLVLQVAGRTAVPVVSLCGDSSVTQTGVPWLARVVPRTIEEAEALFTGLRCDHWVAVTPNGRAGREVRRDLQAAARNRAGTNGQFFEVNRPGTNPARLARQIIAGHPDSVLLWLDPAVAGTMAQALRKAGFAGELAGPGRLHSPDFVAAAGRGAEGLLAPGLRQSFVRIGPPQRTEFAAAYRERFGTSPDATAVMAGDAAWLLVQVLQSAGSHPAYRVFPLVGSFSGASGVLTFDRSGNLISNLGLLRLRGGQWIPEASQIPSGSSNKVAGRQFPQP